MVAHQRHRVIGQAGSLEAGWRVAILATRTVVDVVGRLVAVRTLRASRPVKGSIRVAVGTSYLCVPACQLYRVRCHLYHLPLVG